MLKDSCGNRGNQPRAYEARLLRRLLTVAKKRLKISNQSSLLLLDVGTGYGRDLAWLQKQKGCDALGIDYAHAMLKAAHDCVKLKRGTLAQMDVRRLGFQEESIDIVRAQALFHHLNASAADSAMREIARILKPGGLLSVFVRYGKQEGILDDEDIGPRYFCYYTLKLLKTLLQSYRLRLLENERVIAAQGFPCLAVLAQKPR